MHIAYVVHFAGPQVIEGRFGGRDPNPGATQKVKLICRALLKGGHRVTILSPNAVSHSGKYYPAGSERLTFTEGEVGVLYAPLLDIRGLHRLPAGLWLSRLFRREHRRSRFGGVLVYNIGSTTLLAAREGRRVGLPVILEYEDDALAINPGRESSWLSSAVHYAQRSTVERLTLARMNRLIHGALVVCPELARQLRTKNVIVVPGLLGDDIVAASQLPPPKFDGRRARVVYAGALTYDKGASLAVESLASVLHSVDLEIFGGGPLETRLRQMASRVPDRHSVTIRGFVDRSTLLQGLAGAHVLVNPHRLDIGRGLQGSLFPFKVIEYAATGVPVVSSLLGTQSDRFKGVFRFFEKDTPEALGTAIDDVLHNHDRFRQASVGMREAIQSQHAIDGVSKKLGGVLVTAQRKGS